MDTIGQGNTSEPVGDMLYFKIILSYNICKFNIKY